MTSVERREPATREVFGNPVPRYALGVVALLLVGGMFVLRVYLAEVGDLPGDADVAARWPNPATPEPFDELAVFYATLASPIVALLTVTLATWILWRRLGARFGLGMLLAAVAIPVNAILKEVFGPTQLYSQLTSEAINYPSGHVTYATAVFGYLALVGLHRRRPEVAVVAAIVIAGMGPARVLDGSHLPSDVVGAYLLGLGWALGTMLWVTRR